MTEQITAVGGPLDGGAWPMRCPDGLVLINKPEREALLYDRHANRIVAREIVALEPDRAIDAAMRPNFDVLAYDPETMGAWRR